MQKITIDSVLEGMTLEGWVLHIDTVEGPVKYGTFVTKQEALNWADHLTGLITISPVYSPGYNRG